MSRWGSAFRLVAAVAIAWWNPGAWGMAARWALVASQAESERQRRKRDKANARARAAYNEAQKDRLQMLDLQPDMARTLVLGRVRYVEGVRRRWTSGTHSENLTQVVSFAGHELDAFEQWYVDDMPVTLDGSGYVQEAPYKVTAGTFFTDIGTLDGSGNATLTLAHTPLAGSATASWAYGNGETAQAGPLSVSLAGSVATITGGPAGAPFYVNYRGTDVISYLRIRTYSGTAAQNVGSALAAEYPGKITATDKFAGIAVAVLDMVYSPDVFPQGPPNLTAVMRGAKCYDPRLDSTVAGGSGSHRIATPSTWAWTENPALHALRYALWGSGLGLSYGRGITARTLADVVAAANQCDISTTFTLRMPDTSTTSVTLPRHRCGITISSDADPKAVMDSIVDTMAGEWAFDGPELRLRAGVKASSVASIDQTWLVEAYEPGQEDEERDPVISSTRSITREQRWNRVVGKCVDPAQRYQFLPYPAVSDTTLVSAKGEKRGDLDLPGVNHVAHAQHLASIEIRRRQAGTLQVVQCDPRAELLQLFDVVTETVPDYSISAKPFEVVGVDISLTDAPVRLMLREISDAIFTVDAELKGVDPAPDSDLRAPWDVGALGTLTVTSGTSEVTDGSLLTRTTVTWPAVTGEWIRNGGDIEIQYTRADEAMPAGDWATWIEPGNSTKAIIPGLMAGRPYLFRGRLVQRLPLVKGPWTAQVLHILEVVRGRLISMASNGTEAARLIVSGNSIERVAGGTAGWNAGFYSLAGITGGCRLAFLVPQATEDVFIGLTTGPSADAGFSSILFGWYLGASGQYQVYESGSQKTSGTGYVANTPMAIEYDGASVKYWYGATLVRQIAVPPGLTLYVDGSINDAGGRITAIQFSPATITQRGNLLDSGSWVSGSSGSQGTIGGNRFTQAPPAGTNTIALGVAPDGVRRPMWHATSTGTSSYNGWEEAGALADVPVDHNKMYRLSVWMIPRNVSATQGTYYFGCKPSSVRSVTTGTTDANPFFYTAGRAGQVVDRPYLLVGYIMPSGSGTTQFNQGGVWDGLTGEKIANATDFKWVVDQAVSAHRVAFYGASSGNITDFWDPRFDLCDGTEPRIDQILQVAGSIRTQHVASEAVLKLLSANTGSGNYNSGALGDPHELCLINFTNADPFSVRFAWDAVVIGLYATGTPAYTSDAFWKYSINGGTAVTGRVAPTGGTGDPDVPTSCSAFSEITLAAGDAIAFQLMALASTNDNAFWSGAALRATVHKKS